MNSYDPCPHEAPILKGTERCMNQCFFFKVWVGDSGESIFNSTLRRGAQESFIEKILLEVDLW